MGLIPVDDEARIPVAVHYRHFPSHLLSPCSFSPSSESLGARRIQLSFCCYLSQPQTRMRPQLTIGVPVFNGMPYLPEAIESLLSQTYSDFEILIVDDGSTDAGPEYLRSIKDKRIRILRQPNQGLTATLNRILAEA